MPTTNTAPTHEMPSPPHWADEVGEWEPLTGGHSWVLTYTGVLHGARVRQFMEYTPGRLFPVNCTNMDVIDAGPACPSWCTEHLAGPNPEEDIEPICHYGWALHGDVGVRLMKQDDPKVPLDPAGAAVDLTDAAWIDGITIRNLAQALLLAADMMGVPPADQEEGR